jgi:hypothetical protein
MLYDAPPEIDASIDTTPEDYQRTLIQSRLGPERLLALPPAGKLPEWIVVWSDFLPADAGQERIRKLTEAASPVETFRAGALSVQVYRMRP